MENLFYKFGAEQICGKPKSYVKFLQTIWLSDLFLNRKNLIFLLKIKFYFHFELRNLKFHIVSYSIKKIFKYSKFILMLSCIFILSCSSNKIRGCDGNAQTYELRVMSETWPLFVSLWKLEFLLVFQYLQEFLFREHLCIFRAFFERILPNFYPIRIVRLF